MDAPGAEDTGLAASLRRSLATLLDIGKARLDLLATEVELEKLKVFDALIKAALGLMILGVALLLAVAMLLLMLQPDYRLPALATMVVLALAGAWALIRAARQGLKTGASMFKASSDELERDRSALAPRD